MNPLMHLHLMKNDSKPTLVILTTHFGTNFSGGSSATCEIFSRIEECFQRVVVVGTELGEHPFSKLEFMKYEGVLDGVRTLKKTAQFTQPLFYGDFYNSILFILAGLPYYFTYHDNWPEIGRHGWRNRLRSFFYMPIYNLVFKNAEKCFTVSDYNAEVVKKVTPSYEVIRNGFTSHQAENSIKKKRSVLMVGNIDARKYKYAVSLFKSIEDADFSVDIYGNIKDQEISDNLKAFPFVNIMGYKENIPYSSYNLLLHTSATESLGMIFCEAVTHNVPVLAFHVGGISEVVTEKNGILISDYNLEEMREALLRLLKEEQPFTSNKAVLEGFSWEKAAESYKKSMLL